MSSRLPDGVREKLLNASRDRKGRAQCAGCHQRFVDRWLHVDHIIPEVLGGTHDEWNLQLLCAPVRKGGCHRLKTAAERKVRSRIEPKDGGPWGTFCRWVRRVVIIESLMGLWWCWLSITAGPLAAHAWIADMRAIAILLVLIAIAIPVTRWLLTFRKDAAPAAPVVLRKETSVDTARIVEAARSILGEKGTVTVIDVDSAATLQGFTLVYSGTGFADHSDDRRGELVDRVSAKIGGRWQAHFETEMDRTRFARRPELPSRIDHPGFEQGRPWNVLPISPEASFNLAVTPHVLIQGATGSGKTALMRTLIAALCDSASRGEVQLKLLDPKRVELSPFRGWPGVDEVATSDERLEEVMLEVRVEMERRYRISEEEGRPTDSWMPLVVVLDEAEEYVERMEAYWIESGRKKGATKSPAVAALKSVARLARRCRIHLIVGTQRADASWFGGSLRDQFGGRVGVGPLGADAARMCFGDSSYGRDVPALAKGRATVQIGDGEPAEVQSFYIPDPGDPHLDPRDLAIIERLNPVAKTAVGNLV